MALRITGNPRKVVREHLHKIERYGVTMHVCTPGQPHQPIGCDEHGAHQWCPGCVGWFGFGHHHNGRVA